ncbi:MAG: hypothetical protein M3O30_17285 [Planctomycetota bacterium]|nr:hypothetical protein [Planctomycetota bacterium]
MTARDHALIELDSKTLPDWAPNITHARLTPLSDRRDLALSGQIITGVIKNLFLLGHYIEHFSGKKRRQIDPLVRKILAIALYQLFFLDRVPASAAVDEAVEQVKRFGRRKSSGFVNAVLRNATRQPLPLLPDPSTEPDKHAHIALSHPPELVARLINLLGEERALKFCRHDNAEPPTLIRLFHGVDLAALESADVQFVPHQQAGIFVVTGARQALFGEWAKRGLAQVQDATAAAVVDQMDVLPGQTVVDRCAGLGTKTLQIRERLGMTGHVIAIDPSAARCQALAQLTADRGITSIKIVQSAVLSSVLHELPTTKFDRVLVDAPCSNSGVLARRPEARFAQDAASLSSLARLQNKIMFDTAPFVASGGLLVYSTCSIWPEENQELVNGFLRRQSNFELISQASTLPSIDSPDPVKYHDGGYSAVLRKNSAT